jgi:hypothetical protein
LKACAPAHQNKKSTMHKEASDTFPEAEQTRWQETVAEDVFLPSVRVQLNWGDVQAAVEQGAIVPQQAHALWASWAMPGSPTRLSGDGSDNQRPPGFVESSTLESAWVGRPMPEIQRTSRIPVVVGFVLGALVMFGATALFSSLAAG